MIHDFEDFTDAIKRLRHINESVREDCKDDLDELKRSDPERYRKYWRKLRKEIRERQKKR